MEECTKNIDEIEITGITQDENKFAHCINFNILYN